MTAYAAPGRFFNLSVIALISVSSWSAKADHPRLCRDGPPEPVRECAFGAARGRAM